MRHILVVRVIDRELIKIQEHHISSIVKSEIPLSIWKVEVEMKSNDPEGNPVDCLVALPSDWCPPNHVYA